MPCGDDDPSTSESIVIKATLPVGTDDGYQARRRKAQEVVEYLRRAGWDCEIFDPEQRNDH
jgi:UDP-glucose 6-dehydrogenase